MAFSPDSYLLATGSYDKTARLWNISTKETIALVNHEDTVSSVAFSPVSKNMWATASRDTTAKLWGTSTGSEPREFRHSESVASIAFSPDGRLLVTGCEEMEVYVWPLDNARITG